MHFSQLFRILRPLPSNIWIEETVTLDIEEALQVIDTALAPAALNDIQERVFRGVWEGHSYEKIAENTNYESEYIKHIGYQLWQRLSQSLGEKVTKSNLQSVLRRKVSQLQELAASSNISEIHIQNKNFQSDSTKLFSHESNFENVTVSKRYDWGEAINITSFYGRTEEVTLLQQWILEDHCQLVTLLGMGGIGKTALARKFVEQVQNQFDCLIWRSLRQAPPLAELLVAILKFITPDQDLRLPESEDGQLARLIESLQVSRCLLILDNMESILWGGDSEDTTRQRAGHYRKGYEGYGELLKYVGEGSHQSCLILTSREKPKEIAALEGQNSPVRSLIVRGLPPTDARHILQMKQIGGSNENCDRLIHRYAGNPLALKIVASTVQELFDGDVAEFLQEGISFFGDIGELLDEQFNRLSSLEKQVMFWLALNQEPISLTELNEDIASFISKRELLEALESLGRRPLIEKLGNRFSQQPVVMEYMTEQIIEQAFQELLTCKLSLLESHSLLKATAKDYIRVSQIRLILDPIIEKLKSYFKSLKLTETQIKQALNNLRRSSAAGYGAGNLINLLCQLKIDFEGYDFSHLMIRQAYLRNIDLHHVNFAHANFDSAVLTETFGGILSIAMSSDGALLVASDVYTTIRLWRVSDGRQLWFVKGHHAWIWSVVFSPDNLHIASGCVDETIKLWDASTGECVLTLHDSSEVQAIAFSPDANLILSGGKRDATLWDINSGSRLRTLKGHTDRIWAVTFSPDGRIAVTGSADTTLKAWNIETGECLQTFSGKGWIKSVAFHPGGQVIASGSGDHTINLWNLVTGECLKNFVGHEETVSSIRFSPDGGFLASGSYDCTIKLWQVNSGRCFQTLQGHTSLIWTVTFSPDGKTVVSSGDDHTIKFWDVQTGQCIKTWQGHSNAIVSVSCPPKVHEKSRSTHLLTEIQPNNQQQCPLLQQSKWLLTSGSEDRIIRIWDVCSQSFFKALKGHTARIMSLSYAPDGQTLFSGSCDRTAKLWDVETGQCLKTFYDHSSWIWTVAYSPDGQTLATASEDATARLWNVNGQCLKILREHQGTVYAVAFSPDAKTLATGGLDCQIKLWHISEAEESYKALQEHTNSVLAITFSPDGQNLISSSQDQSIKIWDLAVGQCVKTLEGHSSAVWTIAISPDGRVLASGGGDQTLKLWDFESGKCLKSLTGHQNVIKSITFHSEESIVISGSLDETMKVWDVHTGECLQTLRIERPYEGMNITGTTGLTDAQKVTLKALGAIEVNAV